ncbi:hypothetical protein TRIUR3_25946 [Triticum urartu]|uniref:COBRA C-terminal domain-containing protein n=1 Tax=Triticum urartu TaxID=4572 RepID=M7Y847_TRIUA|nr:hypothetical protein TRIUR3_25946 [Triticum urartu]
MEAMHARLALAFLLFVALAAAQQQFGPRLVPHPSHGFWSLIAPVPAKNQAAGKKKIRCRLCRHQRIRPFVDPAAAAAGRQPYSFRASATVLNNGVRTLPSWALLVAFAHGEILVSLDGGVLTFGDDLPYNTTAAGGGATSLSGNPQTDLLTPIDTAGDLTRIQATVRLVGTLFAGPEPVVTLPSAISLADPAYTCSPVATAPTVLSACCVLIAPDQPSAVPPAAGNTYLPRVTGDLVITYDVLQAHETTYLALVTLENNAPMGRLDGWELSWEWRRGEFVNSMRGAYPREGDARGCLYGPQGQYYKDLDFSKVLNCERRPVVHDLPPSRRDDTSLGQIEHCCRNGTILPKTMDEAQSKSAFQMEEGADMRDWFATVVMGDKSVLSFTKKNGPGDVDVVGGDGFPTKIFFNGEECAMPQMIPSQGAGTRASRGGSIRKECFGEGEGLSRQTRGGAECVFVA